MLNWMGERWWGMWRVLLSLIYQIHGKIVWNMDTLGLVLVEQVASRTLQAHLKRLILIGDIVLLWRQLFHLLKLGSDLYAILAFRDLTFLAVEDAVAISHFSVPGWTILSDTGRLNLASTVFVGSQRIAVYTYSAAIWFIIRTHCAIFVLRVAAYHRKISFIFIKYNVLKMEHCSRNFCGVQTYLRPPIGVTVSLEIDIFLFELLVRRYTIISNKGSIWENHGGILLIWVIVYIISRIKANATPPWFRIQSPKRLRIFD